MQEPSAWGLTVACKLAIEPEAAAFAVLDAVVVARVRVTAPPPFRLDPLGAFAARDAVGERAPAEGGGGLRGIGFGGHLDGFGAAEEAQGAGESGTCRRSLCW